MINKNQPLPIASTDILAQVRNNPAFNAKNSWAWFQWHVRFLANKQGMKKTDMFHQTGVTVSKTFMPGQMMSFFYSAKHKDTLPYWDAFPMIIPFGKTATGFIGINMHYVTVPTRLKLLNKLLSFVNDDTLQPKARMILSWKFLKNASKFPEIAPCIKQYLFGYVKSNFMIIEPKSWPLSIFLPVESFKGASNEQVWKDSKNVIGR